MTLFRKTLKGSLFGDCNPTIDIPKILGLYQSGDIKLDEIITRTYTLDEVNEGYDDLLAGKNVRGVVVARARVTGSIACVAHPVRHASGARRARPEPSLRGRSSRDARGRAARGGAAQRRPRRARGTARHRQVDPAAAGRLGAARRVRHGRGQRRADPGAADRPLRPGAGAVQGLRPRHLRRRPAAGGDAHRRAALRRGAQPDPRGDPQRPADRDVRGGDHRAAAGPGARRRRASPWSRR